MSFLWKLGMAIDSISWRVGSVVDAVKDTKDDLKDFAKDTKDDFKELGEIVVEGSADLAKTAVELSADYVQEKVEDSFCRTVDKVDRFFENCDAILSDDPYIDGKKNGYERASYVFDELYRKQDEENKAFLAVIKRNDIYLEFKLQYIKDAIEKKNSELELLKQKKAENIKVASEASGYSIEDVQVFITDTKCSTLFDLITNKKLKEMKKGEVAGFNEAKKLFESRLIDMKEKYNKAIDEIIINDEKELDLYMEICNDISQINEDIVAMDVFIN